MHVVEEYWVADALKDVIDPVEQIGRTLGARGGVGASRSPRSAARRSPTSWRSATPRSGSCSAACRQDGDLHHGRRRQRQEDREHLVHRGRRRTEGGHGPGDVPHPEGYTKFDFKQFMNVGNQMKNAFKGMGQRKSNEPARPPAPPTRRPSSAPRRKAPRRARRKEPGRREGRDEGRCKDAAKKLGGC
jgi:hypothetical protein